ncbi:MAG: hypothetical protein H6749_10880 [Nitrospiraceae bacterium]|nr:hypothetical protein [Nitrospiraceae bacterium]
MATQSDETYTGVQKDLAHTMMSVARESVALIKRSDQQQSLKLQRKQEWEIYLEFLRMLFNLVDRLSAFYIPVQAQRDFMNNLEDVVADQLKTVLAPSLSASEIDEMEVTLSIGQTVAESRQIYEQHKFVVTDQSKERDQFFQFFSERVAAKAGAPGKKEITSAAFLCGTAVVPALKSLFEDATKPQTDRSSSSTDTRQAQPSSSDSSSPTTPSSVASPAKSAEQVPAGLIKLVSVMSRSQGEEVETWWGLHPQFRRDLPPDEAKELANHMNRATRIVGERFAVVASLAQAGTDQPIGHA